jgi:hypothetical protein
MKNLFTALTEGFMKGNLKPFEKKGRQAPPPPPPKAKKTKK